MTGLPRSAVGLFRQPKFELQNHSYFPFIHCCLPTAPSHSSRHHVPHFWYQIQSPFCKDCTEEYFKPQKPRGVFLSPSSWRSRKTSLTPRCSVMFLFSNVLFTTFLPHLQSTLNLHLFKIRARSRCHVSCLLWHFLVNILFSGVGIVTLKTSVFSVLVFSWVIVDGLT